MAPKNNAKAAKGKGKDASADDAKGKGGKGGAVKGAQSINVRHILVSFFFSFRFRSSTYSSGAGLYTARSCG
jgi:hypothetical protein